MSKHPADRVKAHRIRAKAAQGEAIDADEAAFLDSYATEVPKTGASGSERIVHLDIEERAAATGDHLHPDAYAAATRSEGLRADTLLRIAADALVRANDQYMRLAEHLLARTTAIENAHVAMLEAVREHYLARVEAEAEAKAVSDVAGDDGELADMLKFVLAARQNAAQSPEKSKRKKPKSRKPLGSVI